MHPAGAPRYRSAVPRAATFLAPFAALLLTGCDDVRVGSVESLWLLWLVPALLAFYVYAFRTKTRLLQRFASPEIRIWGTAGLV